MSEPGRRHALSASAAMSTSKTGLPSSIPVAVGSIEGCDGGAETGGSVVGSGLSSEFDLASDVVDIAAEDEAAITLGVARGLELGVLVEGG